MKIAVLTAKANESINKGMLRGEVYQRKIRPVLVEMADTLEEVLAANDELAKAVGGDSRIHHHRSVPGH